MLDISGLEQTLLTERGAWANVQACAQPRAPAGLRRFLYKERNLVERFFNHTKHFHAIATYYDKLTETYLIDVQLASARIWMRANGSMT